ncbi:MAG: hypothetical protein RR034_07295 [Bacteroidales bacterium]
MKKADFLTVLAVILVLAPFFIFDPLYQFYSISNAEHPLLMAFIKFAILATFGEMLGLRIKSGHYNAPGFGIAPRAIVWGLLGMWIALAMGVFRNGIPGYLDRFELFSGLSAAMAGGFSGMKLCGAFLISLMMNTSFAPVFMTLHKITDTHILANGGKLKCLLKPIPVGNIITTKINWDVQWNFVFKKNIPLFWIPAHTITFILPQEMQVLFAALCGVALGLILSIAAMKK